MAPNLVIAAGTPPNTANCNAALTSAGLTVSPNLNFGTLLPATGGGTATVAADALGTLSTFGVTALTGATPTAAAVTGSTPGINGANQCTNQTVNVLVSTSGLVGQGSAAGAPTMALALTTSVVTGGKWDYLTGPLYIGGTLTVGDPSVQTAGPYSGTINIDITFQ